MRRLKIIRTIYQTLLMQVVTTLTTWQTTVVGKAPTIALKDSEAPQLSPIGSSEKGTSWVEVWKRARRWQRSPTPPRKRMSHPRSTLPGYLGALPQTCKGVRKRSPRRQEAHWSTITKRSIGIKGISMAGGRGSWARNRLRVDKLARMMPIIKEITSKRSLKRRLRELGSLMATIPSTFLWWTPQALSESLLSSRVQRQSELQTFWSSVGLWITSMSEKAATINQTWCHKIIRTLQISEILITS